MRAARDQGIAVNRLITRCLRRRAERAEPAGDYVSTLPEAAARWLRARDALLDVPIDALFGGAGRTGKPALRARALGVLLDCWYREHGALLSARSIATLLRTSRSQVQRLLARCPHLRHYHCYYSPHQRIVQLHGQVVETSLQAAGCMPHGDLVVEQYATALDRWQQIDGEAGHPELFRVAGRLRIGVQVPNRYSLARRDLRAKIVEHAPSWRHGRGRVSQARNEYGGTNTVYRRSAKAIERDLQVFGGTRARCVRLYCVPATKIATRRADKLTIARRSRGREHGTIAPMRQLAQLRRAAQLLTRAYGLADAHTRLWRANQLVSLIARYLEPGHVHELRDLLASCHAPRVLVEVMDAWILGHLSPDVETTAPRTKRTRCAYNFLDAVDAVFRAVNVDTPARARYLASSRVEGSQSCVNRTLSDPSWVTAPDASQSLDYRITIEAAEHLGIDLAHLPRDPIYRAGAPPPWYHVPVS